MAATSVIAAFSQLGLAEAQAEAQKSKGRFLESQANINARFAELQAADVERRGEKAAREHQKKVRQLVGSQRAALAAQGVTVDVGTAQDIQTEAAEIGALDVMTIKNNAYRQAFGFKQQAVQDRFQGELARQTSQFQAGQTLISGGLQAATTITQGIGSFAGFASSIHKSGVFR